MQIGISLVVRLNEAFDGDALVTVKPLLFDGLMDRVSAHFLDRRIHAFHKKQRSGECFSVFD